MRQYLQNFAKRYAVLTRTCFFNIKVKCLQKSGLHAVQKNPKAVFKALDCFLARDVASYGIGVKAAAEAPNRIAHGLGINVFDDPLLFGVIDQLFDLGGPPFKVALGDRVVFKYVLIELHFVVVRHNQRVGNNV